nr:unnamed protein product [Callosobruchus analis]
MKEYSDINVKIKTWQEISRIFSNTWGNLSQKQKTDAANASKLLTLIRK